MVGHLVEGAAYLHASKRANTSVPVRKVMPRMLGLVIGCSVAAFAACTASVVVWREATAEV